MTDRLSIDYECYSEEDLPAVGAWAYAAHPSTRTLCMGWRINKDKTQIWVPGTNRPKDLKDAWRDPNVLIDAFNANFERAISELVMSLQHGWSIPALNRWRDTQALAAHCAYPISLASCAKALGIDEQKDASGKRLLKLFSEPQKPTKTKPGGRVLPKHQPEEFKKLLRYCRQDVRTEAGVKEALPIHELPAFEQRIWELDSIINARGVYVDKKLCQGAETMRIRAERDLGPKLRKLTGNAVQTAGQLAKIKAWALTKGVDIPNMQAETVDRMIADKKVPKDVKDVMLIRSLLSQASPKKFSVMLNASKHDGRVRGLHQYHSATTGRWGGRIFQPQNLPKPFEDRSADLALIRAADYKSLDILHGNVMMVLRDTVRHAVAAPPGHILHVVDKASIEARVLGWVAGEEKYLKAYRTGLDLYKVTAAEIYQMKYEDIEKGSPERFLGKESVLGLGYNMGADAFYAHCIEVGLDVPRKLIDKAVETYRRTYTAITRFWKDIEKAIIISAVRKVRTRLRCLTFEPIGNAMTILLPSGRRLFYPEYEVNKGRTPWGEERLQLGFKVDVGGAMPWRRARTYGGRLTENVVQAIARDVLANSLLLAEKAGLNPVMHVHDEIVCEVKTGTKLDLLLNIMKTVPKWAPGLPLATEGFETNYYRK